MASLARLAGGWQGALKFACSETRGRQAAVIARRGNPASLLSRLPCG